jgi:hypothetical protein
VSSCCAHNAEWHYFECFYPTPLILNVIMLNAIEPNAVLLSVIMLCP